MPNPYVSPLVVEIADGAQILNTTTQSFVAPAYQFNAKDVRIYQGAAFEIDCWFDISNVVTTPGTVRFRVKRIAAGGAATTGTVLAQTDAIAMDTTARANYSGHLRAALVWRSIGSAGTAFCQGYVLLNNVPVGAAADPQGIYTMGSAGENVPAVVGSLDTTAAWDLGVTAEFSVPTATTQLTSHIFIVKAVSS